VLDWNTRGPGILLRTLLSASPLTPTASTVAGEIILQLAIADRYVCHHYSDYHYIMKQVFSPFGSLST